MSLSLSLESLKALEDLRIGLNLSSKSEDASEFPFSALLTLYAKARRTLYLNHYEDFLLLKEWLEPIGETSFLPQKLEWFELNYELNTLAILLQVHPSQIIQELKYGISQAHSG